MFTQKTFARLAIAAGLLLTASATSFAQTGPVTAQAESDATIVAVNKTPKFNFRKAETNSSVTSTESMKTEVRPQFSATSFISSAKDSLTNANLTMTPEIRIAPVVEPTKFSEPAKSERIDFVPSRGPRPPQ